MAIASAIDIWLRFEVLSQANLLNVKQQNSSMSLSLYSAMREAVMVNLDLDAADRKNRMTIICPNGLLVLHASVFYIN